jgi:hypothetical protein
MFHPRNASRARRALFPEDESQNKLESSHASPVTVSGVEDLTSSDRTFREKNHPARRAMVFNPHNQMQPPHSAPNDTPEVCDPRQLVSAHG